MNVGYLPTDPKTQQFIEKAKAVHSDKYDYSKAVYIHSKEKLVIICAKHGEFFQIPNAHLRGQGCPVCAGAGTSNAERELKP